MGNGANKSRTTFIIGGRRFEKDFSFLEDRPKRFRQRRFPIIWIIVGLVVLLLLVYASYVYLNWVILEYMYETKANLDWFGITFYNGLTFTVAAFLALLLINPIPKASDVADAFNAFLGMQARQPWKKVARDYPDYGNNAMQDYPLKRRPTIRPGVALWIFWQISKWVVAFLIFVEVNGFLGLGNIAIPLLMSAKGYGDWSTVGKIFLLPLYPGSGPQLVSLMPSMEIQYRIISYFLVSGLIIVTIRFFLKFVRDAVRRAGDKWIRNLLFSLASLVMILILEAPYWAMDITTPYVYGIVITIFFAFVIFGLFFHLKSGKETMTFAQRRRIGILLASVVIGAVLVANVAIIGYYRINWNNGWINYEWAPLTSRQVFVMRWAAGIQDMNYTGLTNIPAGNATATLGLVRQWDGNASYTESTNRIGVNWMQLVPQPEIVYVNNHEYWATPTTFAPVASDWISNHLIYTHTSKIIVIDSHSGDLVPAVQAFNIPVQPLIYYGEGFNYDAYVDVPGAPNEIENVSYHGAPDFILSGWQRSLWFLIHEGQLGYAFSPPADSIRMLHDRDVFHRVNNLLIYGLSTDQATYLVSDNKTLYYCIQVYIDYPIHSGYAHSEHANADYLRFFGVVLVNVADGSLKGYTVGQNDGFLDSFYKSYYKSWGPAPEWLVKQLRYPEQLLGNQTIAGQLDVDFFYHVNSASVWRSGQDFFERPLSTEVLYVPIAIGNNIYFAAVQLVEFQSSASKNLAGVYVIYGGDRLGQMALYEANSTASGSVPLIGPSAALQAFRTDPTTQNKLTLLHAVPGNILLYLINGHLYYFIPAYIYTQSDTGGSGVIAKEAFIDAIDASNGSVGLGINDSFGAFSALTGGLRSSGPGNRISTLLSMFPSNYILTNVTAVNPTVYKLAYTANFTSLAQLNQTQQTVNDFINNYVKPAGNVTQLLWWMPNSSTVDIGYLETSSNITWLYYMQVNVGSGVG
jgi:hypothetical protein